MKNIEVAEMILRLSQITWTFSGKNRLMEDILVSKRIVLHDRKAPTVNLDILQEEYD